MIRAPPAIAADTSRADLVEPGGQRRAAAVDVVQAAGRRG